MNTTNNYIYNRSVYDQLYMPKTRFREIKLQVQPENKAPYISRIIKLNRRGKVLSELHTGGWKAVPPGVTIEPKLSVRDEFIYNKKYKNITIISNNKDDHHNFSKKTIQFNKNLIESEVHESYYNQLTIKYLSHLIYNDEGKLFEIKSSMYHNGICNTRRKDKFYFDNKNRINKKTYVSNAILEERIMPMFNVSIDYYYNNFGQLKISNYKTVQAESNTVIKTTFDYLNEAGDEITKIQSFEKDILTKTIMFNYDDHQELFQQIIDEEGKEKIVLNYIGSK